MNDPVDASLVVSGMSYAIAVIALVIAILSYKDTREP